ncbi:hypothetical protein Tco_0140026 [Tanacetum coccineum]
MKEKLSQDKDSQEEVVGEFNSSLDNIIEKLSQDLVEMPKEPVEQRLDDNVDDDFLGFMYDTDDDASISDQAIEDVVVKNNDLQELVYNPTIYEEVVEEVVERANDQDESKFNQEVADDFFDDEEVKQARPSKRIRVTQEEMINDEKANKG